MILNKDFKEFIGLLEKHEVKYLVATSTAAFLRRCGDQRLRLELGKMLSGAHGGNAQVSANLSGSQWTKPLELVKNFVLTAAVAHISLKGLGPCTARVGLLRNKST